MRAGNGRATPNATAAQSAISQLPISAAAREDGTSSIRVEHGPAQAGESGIVGDIAGDQISDQVRIRQFEKFDEGGAFVACGTRAPISQVAQQQEIEFLHSAPAAPLEHSQALARHFGKRRRNGAVR
jgi:hypothetical protein